MTHYWRTLCFKYNSEETIMEKYSQEQIHINLKNINQKFANFKDPYIEFIIGENTTLI